MGVLEAAHREGWSGLCGNSMAALRLNECWFGLHTDSLRLLAYFSLPQDPKSTAGSLIALHLRRPLAAVASSFHLHPYGAADQLEICSSVVHLASV